MKFRFCFLPIAAVLLAGAIPARSQTLDDQERCAAQAKRAFEKYQVAVQKHKKAASIEYESHYNTKIGKCFMLGQNQGPNGARSAWLLDAYEGRRYAFYFWVPIEVEKYSEIPPAVCELRPSRLERKTCADRNEFDDFVADYMEN